MTVGDRIRQVRQEQDVTQQELADYIGVSKQAVYKYENNIPVADEAQLFYHTDSKNESFLDIAEWDARVVTSVALGRNLIIGI